jgi:hypothetical protein
MHHVLLIFVTAALVAAATGETQRAGAFSEARDHPAIDYTKGQDASVVTALNDRLARGQTRLGFEPARGYLRSVLE